MLAALSLTTGPSPPGDGDTDTGFLSSSGLFALSEVLRSDGSVNIFRFDLVLDAPAAWDSAIATRTGFLPRHPSPCSKA